MPPPGFKRHGVSVERYGLLCLPDGGHGFDGDAKANRFAVGDAALNAAAEIGQCAQPVALAHKAVIMLRAAHAGAAESRADLKAFHRRNGQHGLRQSGFELFKHRFTQAGGQPPADTGDGSAQRVFGVARLFDARCHVGGGGGIRTAYRRGIHGVTGQCVFRNLRRFNRVDGTDVGGNGQLFKLTAKPFFSDGTCADPADGFARTGASAAAGCLDAVFHEVAVIGVRGTRHGGHVAVIAGALVAVVDRQTDRCAEGLTVFCSGENGDQVFFVARSRQCALSRPAAVELRLNILFTQCQPGRTAVHHGTDRFAVGFAECGDPKKCSKRAAHAVLRDGCCRGVCSGSKHDLYPAGGWLKIIFAPSPQKFRPRPRRTDRRRRA